MLRVSRRIAAKHESEAQVFPPSSYEEPIVSTSRSTELQTTPVRRSRDLRDHDSINTPISSFSEGVNEAKDYKSADSPSIPISPLRRMKLGHSGRTSNTSLDVTSVYKTLQKSTGFLGGNGAFGAIYGELTQGSMQVLINYMKAHCELSQQSRFIDIGSGLGKPSFHVAYDVGCELSYGIELELLRYQLCMINLKSVLSHCPSKGAVGFQLGDAFQLSSIEPFTHIFQFDLGFPPSLQQSIAAAFNKSSTAKYLISFRPPRRVVGMYGYKVKLIGKQMTNMCGSSEGHTCYFYVKIDKNKKEVTPRYFSSVLSACPMDGAFSKQLGVYLMDNWKIHVQSNAVNEVSSYLNSSRPIRRRKDRVLFDY